MEINEHIDSLERDGQLLTAAASGTPMDSPVPSCPEWQLRNLLEHTGSVQRWAGRHVAEGLTERARFGRDDKAQDQSDAEIIGWFADGHAELVNTMRGADPELQCWTFLPSPSPVAFWARRQAHETAIHRVDAELAAGRVITPFPADFATDGLDELLVSFLGFRRADYAGEPDGDGVITVNADDSGMAWHLEMNGGRAPADQQPFAGRCTIAGRASDLYLLFWNRIALDGAEFVVSGDADLLRRYREERAI